MTNVIPINQITSGTRTAALNSQAKKFSKDTLTYICVERFDWLSA